MEKADGLSRRPDQQEGVKKDNKDQMLIKLGWIKKTEILVEEDNLRGRIKRAQKEDKKVNNKRRSSNKERMYICAKREAKGKSNLTTL